MTPVRTLATVRHHAMELTDYEFTVPLVPERRCRFLCSFRPRA